MKKLFLMLLACSFLMQGAFAQPGVEDPLPQDPETIVGKLPNGITYYIRHNEHPKDRASFYIIRNVGALLETEEQNGLAHFLEHMSFQGTRHFPGKGIISTLEKHGVAFGRDINAYTAHNETVYNLSSVPTRDVQLLDTCLWILHDWSYFLSLEEKEIDAERGVISEEWRTRRTPSFRLQRQMAPVLFKGSMYAIRDVIGSLDVINHFEYQTIRDFYHKWYRTDLEAVAIVGDFDVKRMEEKVKEILSRVPAVQDPTPRPFFEIPYHEEMYYCLATDKEAKSPAIQINTVFPDTPGARKNTHGYLKENVLVSLYNAMAASRISELLLQAKPPFLNGEISFSGLVRGYNTYNISAIAKAGEEAEALESILSENERIRRFGFTRTELERVKSNMLAGLESAYKEKEMTDNDSYASIMQEHFLEQSPMVSADYYYNYAKYLLSTVTVEEVNRLAATWNAEGNRTVIITGPEEKDGIRHLTQKAVSDIMEKVRHSDIKPYEDKVSNGTLITEEPAGGRIVKTRELSALNAVEWTLDNGCKVVFRKADYEKDAVSLLGFSKGGTSVYGLDMLPSAREASSFIPGFGLGDHDGLALKKLLTGKMAVCNVNIGGMYEEINGASTPQDLETLMQLLYLRFEKPRFDKDIFASIMNRQLSVLPSILKNPQKIMQDSIMLIMSCNHPRNQIVDGDYLNRISLDKIEKVYRDRIKDASDFTFIIVGNTEEEVLRPLVEKYIGSLESEYRKENWIDHHVKGPEGRTERIIGLDLEVPKATVITSFSKEMKTSIHDDLCNEILQGVLELRYTENIREKEGGTYGVTVSASSSREPVSQYGISMTFECDPANAARLKALIYEEVDKIVQAAPSTEDVGKVVRNIAKNREQSRLHNDFWTTALYNYYMEGINTADPSNFEDVLKKITPADIHRFARKLFKDADIVDLTFVPKDK